MTKKKIILILFPVLVLVAIVFAFITFNRDNNSGKIQPNAKKPTEEIFTLKKGEKLKVKDLEIEVMDFWKCPPGPNECTPSHITFNYVVEGENSTIKLSIRENPLSIINIEGRKYGLERVIGNPTDFLLGKYNIGLIDTDLASYVSLSIRDANKDPNLCRKIDDGKKTHCFINLVNTTRNFHFCEEITNYYDRVGCYTKSAEELNNSDLCKQAENQDDCIKNVAIRNNNYGLCKDINDSIRKDYCFSNIAWQLKNKSLCDEIAEENRKKSCRSHFEEDPD